jgi:hypothetical protein
LSGPEAGVVQERRDGLLGHADPLADLPQAQAFSAEFADLLAAFHVG